MTEIEIAIGERQHEYLDRLRAQLADEHVGDYGHVRYRDVVQYLIDHHESTGGDVGAAPTAESDPEVAGESDGGESVESSDHDEGDASGDDEGDEKPDGEEGRNGAESDSDGSASRLQRMMGLLDDHDDVWERTDSEEGRYAVTLPDGSTERVRTKDDVRALLFQHYD